jgi:cytochrome b
LVTAFIVAYLSSDSEEWRLIHVTAGYAMAGALAFRLFWGMVGTRYARFKSFIFSPNQLFVYLGGLLKGKPVHWIGHNPAGSYAIYALIFLGCAVVGSGWAVYADMGGEWLTEVHDAFASAMLGMVGLHVLGVVISSRLHNENLVRSMVTGLKLGKRAEAIVSSKKYWAIPLIGSVLSASLMSLFG